MWTLQLDQILYFWQTVMIEGYCVVPSDPLGLSNNNDYNNVLKIFRNPPSALLSMIHNNG